MRRVHSLLIAGSAALLTGLAQGGCGSSDDDGGSRGSGGSGATDSGAPDSSSDGSTECVPPLEGTSADGHGSPLGAGSGEARAGRIGAGELPPHEHGLLTWAPGDFVLANDRVALVVEDVGASDGFDPWGGKPIGAARVEGGALVEPADFGEMFLAVGRYILQTESVGVVNDGADGQPAVVRATGSLAPLPALDALAKLLLPNEFDGVDASVDYSLAPDAEHVDVSLSLRSTRTDPTDIPNLLTFFFQATRMPAYSPGLGFRAGGAASSLPYIAFVEDDATSYAYRAAEGDIKLFLALSGATIYRNGTFELAACSAAELPYGRIDIGGPGADGLRQAIARTDGETLRRIEGQVTEPGGAPSAGVRVHAVDGSGGYLTRATTDAMGRYALHVPQSAVELTPYRRGNTVPAATTVAASESIVDLTLGESGRVHVSVNDGLGGPLPAKVQILPLGDVPAAPETFGEPSAPDGRLYVELPADGDVTLRVPVGRHRVIASRGYEYEIFSTEVDVAAGATVDVDAPLSHSVPTAGAVCGDFHLHTHRSVDAPDTAHLKVLSAAGEGLEIPVRSEHEWVASFEPQIADLGLESWVFGIASHELTTFEWGHFGVFPLAPDPSAPNAGGIGWTGRLPPEVLDDARSRAGPDGPPAIIVNHARTFCGLGTEGCYFTAAGYDPSTGAAARPELWDEKFRLFEVFNASSFDENFDETVRDWFSFLDEGRPMFAVGSSDSHTIDESPVGYPRTCIDLGVETASAARVMGAGAIRDRMLAGHMVVSGGIVIDALGPGGEKPGDTVAGAGAMLPLAVRVRAPIWVDVDELRVFVDGAEVDSVTLDASTVDPGDLTVRFDGTLDVPIAAGSTGSHVILVASGSDALDPVTPGRRPFGVTNPIFATR